MISTVSQEYDSRPDTWLSCYVVTSILKHVHVLAPLPLLPEEAEVAGLAYRGTFVQKNALERRVFGHVRVQRRGPSFSGSNDEKGGAVLMVRNELTALFAVFQHQRTAGAHLGVVQLQLAPQSRVLEGKFWNWTEGGFLNRTESIAFWIGLTESSFLNRTESSFLNRTESSFLNRTESSFSWSAAVVRCESIFHDGHHCKYHYEWQEYLPTCKATATTFPPSQSARRANSEKHLLNRGA